nr:hypothetical protein [Tanacetum cinerariifolium]
LNPADQDSLNSAAGGNLLERRTQDVLTIIKNKSKVRNSRNKSVVSQVKSSDANSNSSSVIDKLTHAVNQQTSDVTTAMTAILKQFQATLPLASVKSVEEICVTYGGAHPYYQCLAAGGNTFPEIRDNIQGYVVAAAVNYNQGNFGCRPSASTLGSGHLPSNTIANPKGELKAITTRSGPTSSWLKIHASCSKKLCCASKGSSSEFLKTIDENMKRIIKEQVKSQVKDQVSRILPRIEQSVNAQLEYEVLTRSSRSSRTSYAVAADLSEMELKKILIEKMEGNKSIQRSDEQRNL